jgi:hypothetical protein
MNGFVPARGRGHPAALRAALALAAAPWLAAPPAARAGEPIFADGFEVCDATHWSSASGLPDCSAELACAAPSPGEACVAGRLFDLETSRRLCTSPVSTSPCAGSGAGGPCALEIRVFEAFSLLSDPGGAIPLAADETRIDGCGRFRVSGFPAPGLGFGAVSADDAGDSADAHLRSAALRPMAGGSTIEDLPLYVVRHATDAAWTSSAGDPFSDATFGETGTYVAIFLHAGAPVAGVQLLSDGSPVATDDFYFSDSAPASRSVVDAGLAATGVNGSALFVPDSIAGVSGSGGEPEGCSWPEAVGGSAPGLVVVQELAAEVDGQPGVACP